jgi:hypothetical protein
MTFNTDKTNSLFLKVSTYIIISITSRPIGLSAILVIMSVATFKTAILLYLLDFSGSMDKKLKTSDFDQIGTHKKQIYCKTIAF